MAEPWSLWPNLEFCAEQAVIYHVFMPGKGGGGGGGGGGPPRQRRHVHDSIGPIRLTVVLGLKEKHLQGPRENTERLKPQTRKTIFCTLRSKRQ